MTARQAVTVMDRHVGQRQAVAAGQKPLPMRDGVHVDPGESHLAQNAAVEDRLPHPHRAIMAHVLVDADHLARRLRRIPPPAAQSPQPASGPAVLAPRCP